jgi:hypothetical protein
VLYSTTQGGGRDQWGSVFALRPPTVAGKPWSEADLWTFNGGIHFGFTPKAGLSMDSSGALYGTVAQEDAALPAGAGGGEVLKLAP